jgi:hypothetical protein
MYMLRDKEITMNFFHGRYKETDEGFELLEEISIQTGIIGFEADTKYVSLTVFGLLTIRVGFVWNASGPTVDSLNTREASCYHDAVYSLADAGVFLGPYSSAVKIKADNLLYDMLRKNGMSWLRAQVWHKSVSLFGSSYWEKGKKRHKGLRRRRSGHKRNGRIFRIR